jgi:hypothetical protein
MSRLLAIAIGALALTAMVGVPAAVAHGGDEMEIEGLKMQPASTLAQQALVELKVNGDTEDAAARLDAALESEDMGGIDMALLKQATETLDGGDPAGAIPLLDEALSRPNGAKSGAALHEAGQEFQPATGAQEIVAIVAGASLILLGVFSLKPWRRERPTSSLG